jgi:hypothetical protein
MAKREGYSKRMERNLTEWKQRFEARLTDAHSQGDKLPRETREDLERLKSSFDAAGGKLRELREAASKWLALRDQMETEWQSLAEALPEAPPAATDAPSAPGPRRVVGAG